MRTLFILSLLLVTVFPCLVLSKCSQIIQRYEIRSLPPGRLARYINAVLALKKAPSGGGPSVYDTLVNVHLKNVPYAHGVPAFFPWHRQYLRNYEAALQAIDPTVTVPYWDWTLDSQSPESSIVFTDKYFGGNGGADGCLKTGPFASWQNFYPTPSCLRRKFSANGKINAFYSPEAVQQMVDRATMFDGLRTTIEGAPHGVVHVGIGGDMSTMSSPNDPIFWLHHAKVDKIWADWQKKDPSLQRDYGGTDALLTNVLAPFNSQVSDVMDTLADGLCYEYAEYWETQPEVPQPPAPPPPAPVIVPTSKPVGTTTVSSGIVSSPASSNPAATSHNHGIQTSQPTESTEPAEETPVDKSSGVGDLMSESIWSFFRSVSVTRYQKLRTPLPARKFIWTKETSLTTGQTVLGGTSTTDTHTTHEMDMDTDMDMDMDMTTSDPADQPDFDYRHMGYQAPPSDDRADTRNLRIPKPMPYAWLRAMKFDIGVTRATEMAIAQMTDELNKMTDYVSPAALVNTGGGSKLDTTVGSTTKALRRRRHLEL